MSRSASKVFKRGQLVIATAGSIRGTTGYVRQILPDGKLIVIFKGGKVHRTNKDRVAPFIQTKSQSGLKKITRHKGPVGYTFYT